jgi:ribosome-associated protein
MATKKAKPARSSKPAASSKKSAPKKATAKATAKPALKGAKKISPALAARQRVAARNAVLALREETKAARAAALNRNAPEKPKPTANPLPAAPLADDPSRDVALLCARAVIDKKAQQTLILEVGSRGSFADYFLISSGSNEKQVQAMADEAVTKLKKSGHMPKVEGYEGGRWILVDAGSVVLHLFHDDIRGYYRLEDLWQDATRVNIPADFYTAAQFT